MSCRFVRYLIYIHLTKKEMGLVMSENSELCLGKFMA